jgi:peptide/nickel transport system permease protein
LCPIANSRHACGRLRCCAAGSIRRSSTFNLWQTFRTGLFCSVRIGVFKRLDCFSRFVDRLSTIFVLIGTSLPTFLTGLLLLVFVVIRWGLIPFPSGNYTSFFENPFEWAQILFLPWLTLAFAYAALYTRFVRSSVIDTSNEDYIRTARAKGLSESVILGKHTLRAALAPIATMAGLDFAGLLGGAILTESVFNLPGLGRLAISAVTKYDLPIIVATTLLAAFIVVMMNLIVDILYAYIDPRVRVA